MPAEAIRSEIGRITSCTNTLPLAERKGRCVILAKIPQGRHKDAARDATASCGGSQVDAGLHNDPFGSTPVPGSNIKVRFVWCKATRHCLITEPDVH
jgi:hypothetical protein